MTNELTWGHLVDACKPGGPSVLTEVTELAPAAGPQASVAPGRFLKGTKAVFDFQTRYIDGQAQQVVGIDSKQSQLNRVEAALSQAIDDQTQPIAKLPRIEVTYGSDRYRDIDLPHRCFDGHIRAGSINGAPTTADKIYRSIRNATPKDSSAIFANSPAVLVFGGWDSTRKSNQVRLRSALVGEIIGVLADQDVPPEENIGLRGGARVDPVGMSLSVSGAHIRELAAAQSQELSAKNLKQIEEDIKRAKKELVSTSRLGLGGVPPTLETIGGVSCKRITRSWVLSFATLRQIRFGSTPEGDAACRALLAALALDGVARADQELYLRANCDLVETAEPTVKLDKRYGKVEELAPLTVENLDQIVAKGIAEVSRLAGIEWDGQVLEVLGDSSILAAANDDSEAEE